jgi:hypothetical protein
MSIYINTQTLEYPRHIGDIQLVYPDATYDNVPEVFQKVQEAEVPECSSSERFEELSPVFDGTQWNQVFVVKAVTEQERNDIARALEEQRLSDPSQQPDTNQSGSQPNVIG